MSSDRVIQDSDDSEDDLATLQSPEKTANQPPHQEPQPSNPDGSNTSLDQNLSINFDEFLVSPEDKGHVSLSQEQRENAWLGAGDEGPAVSLGGSLIYPTDAQANTTTEYVPEETAYPTPSISAIPGQRSPWKSSLKRGRTIDVSTVTETMNNSSKEGRKRRKTMNHSITVDGERDDFSAPAPRNVVFNFERNDDDGNAHIEGASIAIAHVHPESELPAGSAHEAEHGEGVPVLEHDDLFMLNSSPSKRVIAGAKSVQTASHSSPHDTEPFSSVRPRARRTATEVTPLSSPEASHDELALPASVHAALNSTMRDRPKKDTHVDVDAGRESDGDELGSEEHIGLPREYYEPRPSRSRSSRLDETNAGPTQEETKDHVKLDSEEYIGLPRECYKPRPSRSRSIRLNETNARASRDERTKDQVAIVVPPVREPDPLPNVVNDGATDDFDNHGAEIPVGDDTSGQGIGPPALEQDSNAPMPVPPSKAQLEKDYEPPKHAKRGPKKKLKRGKTTSVMMKKVVDSDIEDDVIWVDEKPSKVKMGGVPEELKQAGTETDSAREKAGDRKEMMDTDAPTEDINVERAPIQPNASDEPPPPAPKKRGRKRKKTSEIPPPEPEAPDLPDTVETNAQDAEPEVLTERDPNTAALPTTEHDTRQQNPLQDTETKAEEIASEPKLAMPLGNPPASPTKPTTPPPIETHETPKKATPAEKGPDKHSPLSTKNKVPYRVGLSRSARIAPLLKVIRK